MNFSKDQINGLGVAFNEATLLGVEVSAERSMCAITLALLTLPTDGPPPEDRRIQILLSPVGRLAASLRNGRWDDASATVDTFMLSELLKVVQSFQGLPIYGWEFIDKDEKDFKLWSDRLSLDWHGDDSALDHSITLFQEGPERHIDIKIWFRDLEFRTPAGVIVPITEIISGGKRWWDGLYSGDQRTKDLGIFPMGTDNSEQGGAANPLPPSAPGDC